MKKTDMGNSIISRLVPVFIRENKRKRRLWAATGTISVTVFAVVMLALAVPGFTAEPPDNSGNYPEFTDHASINEYSDDNDNSGGNIEYGRAYQASFSYTYDGRAGESAFLRFNPLGKYANSATVDGEEVFCLQYLTYTSNIAGGEVQRLSFDGSDDYNYYPHRMQTGETVTFYYTLYFQHEISALDINSINFEVIQARNSASIIKWNVIIENGTVYPFDDSLLRTVEYNNYDIPHYVYEDMPTPFEDGSYMSEKAYNGNETESQTDTDGNIIGYDDDSQEPDQYTDETYAADEPLQEEQNIDETSGAYDSFQTEPFIGTNAGTYDSIWEEPNIGANAGTYDSVWEETNYTGAGYDPFWQAQQTNDAAVGSDPLLQDSYKDDTSTDYDPARQSQQTDDTGTQYDPYWNEPYTDDAYTGYDSFWQEPNAGYDTVWQEPDPYTDDTGTGYDPVWQEPCTCDNCGQNEPVHEWKLYVCENCGLTDHEWAESDTCENCIECEYKQTKTYICENCGAYKKPT